MTAAVESPPLRGQGVAVLLAYWAELYPPAPGRPGVVCSGNGQVTVRAVGYACATDRRRALKEAVSVCEDAGLAIAGDPARGSFITRRRGGNS